MSETMYYFAQKYGGIEDRAMITAMEWVNRLSYVLDYDVYSPILNTHPLDQFMIKNGHHIDGSKYVEADLRFIAHFLHHNSDGYCQAHNQPRTRCDEKHLLDCKTMGRMYDTGLIMLFHKSAFIELPTADPINLQLKWNSNGCKTEYRWAIKYNVQCITLDSFFFSDYDHWAVLNNMRIAD